MLFPQGQTKGDRSLDSRWHEQGRRAKGRTFNLDEWSDRDTKRWDLDTDSRRPTGRKNPHTYRYDKPLRDANRSGSGDRTRDVRDNPRIG